MKLYRGCKEAGLKIMEPRLVNHGVPYVYATTDKVEAILYSVPGGNLNYTNIFKDRCLIERKEHWLEKIYNREGRYYILDSTTFKKHEVIGASNNEYVSTEPVKVIEEVTIPNVWNYFKELESNGQLKIYRYPDRPSEYPKDDSDLIECAMLSFIQMNSVELAFGLLEKYHPELITRINETKEFVKSHTKDEIEKSIKFFK